MVKEDIVVFCQPPSELVVDEDIVRFAVDHARALGAEYSEARLQRNKEISCILKNGRPEPATIEDAYGISVRVLYQGALAFTASNDLRNESVRAMVEEAIKRARAASTLLPEKVAFTEEKPAVQKYSAPEKRKAENVGVETLLKELRALDSLAIRSARRVKIPNRLHALGVSVQEKVYANSEGANLRSRIPRVEYFSFLTAIRDGQTAQRSLHEGQSGGWERFDKMKIDEAVEHETQTLELVLTKATKPPTGEVDVIMSPEVSGIAAHESVGHPSEADRILGREAAQAGESYLKRDSMGLRIGSEQAYLSDDPTLPNSYGFYLFDDEGVQARKRRLIEGGVVTEFLHNRNTAHKFGLSSNASSRSVRYDREPIVRMGNTFVEPGDWTLEEMLEDVHLGIYMKSFMEWNIDDKRLNQRYTGFEAYLIEHGKLKGLVKSPVLEITTQKLWTSVDARGRNLEFFAGSCGKGDPMQGCPVWMGGPDTRLRKVRIGVR